MTTDDGTSPIARTFPEHAVAIEVTPAPPGLSVAQTGYRWRTPLGDTVEVWQAAPLGHPLDWRWHVQAPNGEIVGQGEGHPRRRSARVAAMRYHWPAPPVVRGELHVVLDGPPGPEAGRFVELEDADGRSIDLEGIGGRWEHRIGGQWHLVIPEVPTQITVPGTAAEVADRVAALLRSGLAPGQPDVVAVRGYSDSSPGLGAVTLQWAHMPRRLAEQIAELLVADRG